jgi:phosphoenolpyruvate carboxykinase (GTP)
MKMVEHDSIFTNVAMTADGDIWWEGMDVPATDGMLDWQGRPWSKGSKDKAAHPNSRFTTPMRNNPAWSPAADDPRGVPISAIIFGGRRASTVPLVLESTDWTQGVFMGATMGSETTAAASGAVGVLRRDPMAMLPFCGYNMGDYFAHWLKMRAAIKKPPRIFMVNWFRKGADGNFIWPGYGENLRVLKWMLDRIHGRAGGRETPVGIVPNEVDLDLKGLDLAPQAVREALAVRPEEWSAELESAAEFFEKIGPTMPQELTERRKKALATMNSRPSEARIAAGR